MVLRVLRNRKSRVFAALRTRRADSWGIDVAAETKVKLISPSGDEIEAIWTGDRLLVFMTGGHPAPGLGAKLVAYDSHVAGLIEQGLLEVEGTQQVR